MANSECSSASSSDTEDLGLSDRIMQLEVVSEFDKVPDPKFVPEGKLDLVITKKTILEELCDEDGEVTPELEDLARFIDGEAKKLFAIVVRYIGLEPSSLLKAMKLFKDGPNGGFTDKKLPIPPLGEDPKSDASTSHVLTSFNPPGRKRVIWDRARIARFYTDQWKVLVPVFEVATETKYNDDFELGYLPFIKKYENEGGRGAFGQVCKYKIHPNHLRNPNNPKLTWKYVAVKEIQPTNEQERKKMIQGWKQEASVLQQMNALEQPHIVQFITAFRRGEPGREDHYLMFEWADGINLRNLWRTYPRPSSTANLVKETVQQILGLATALREAHYPELRSGRCQTSFRHGDLKPENILWFKDQDNKTMGILKIADWGLAKRHDIVTELRSHKTSTDYGTRRYESPEEETGVGVSVEAHRGSQLTPGNAMTPTLGKRRSRLYDIWAMGCITLEFIVWLLYGADGLNDFNRSIGNDDAFYEIQLSDGKKTAVVHHVVREWMGHMATQPACYPGTAVGDLLYLVKTRLLVVELPERLGTSPDLSTVSGAARRDIPFKAPFLDATFSPLTPAAAPQETQLRSSDWIPTIQITSPDEKVSPGPYTSPLINGQVTANRTIPRSAIITHENGKPNVAEEIEGKARARADEFVMQMEEIMLDQTDSYWLVDQHGLSVPDAFHKHNSHEQHHDDFAISTRHNDHTQHTTVNGLAAPLPSHVDYGSTKLDGDWEYLLDNEFAQSLLSTLRRSKNTLLPHANPPVSLCGACSGFPRGLWNRHKLEFNQTYQIEDLQKAAQAKTCELCALLWQACQRQKLNTDEKITEVTIERTGSFLRFTSLSPPALSIFRNPEFSDGADNEVQIGFAQLPSPTSAAHFEVIKQWLRDCDYHHTCMHKSTYRKGYTKGDSLPTRLIDVGSGGSSGVRLIETSSTEKGRWLALSHQWGPEPHFLTTVNNIASHLQGIPLSSLAATFADAVHVTRALGYRYLWIDSICIIQGPGGDFGHQMKRMEQVYAGADCVLALSRGEGHQAGFLASRKERGVVAFQGVEGRGEFYIAEHVDDFQTDVLNGPLSRRGWVLQEHALARRTVFFTDRQVYWECGEGVRCETGTRMKNTRAALLGDPRFPQVLMKAPGQAEKILRYQNLFKEYSSLTLTKNFDRPTAIDGLQDRILRALNVQGGFGILDEEAKGKQHMGLLRRSLLWCRASDTTELKRIEFPEDRAISFIPSWSWMAYSGAIDYIFPAFNGIDWAKLKSPWSTAEEFEALRLTDVEFEHALVADAREYNPPPDLASHSYLTNGYRKNTELIFDRPDERGGFKPFCVVLGYEREAKDGDRLCYVLLIREVTGVTRKSGGLRVFERVGAGFMSGDAIRGEGEKVVLY